MTVKGQTRKMPDHGTNHQGYLHHVMCYSLYSLPRRGILAMTLHCAIGNLDEPTYRPSNPSSTLGIPGVIGFHKRATTEGSNG